jgi:hypothetical protein
MVYIFPLIRIRSAFSFTLQAFNSKKENRTKRIFM